MRGDDDLDNPAPSGRAGAPRGPSEFGRTDREPKRDDVEQDRTLVGGQPRTGANPFNAWGKGVADGSDGANAVSERTGAPTALPATASASPSGQSTVPRKRGPGDVFDRWTVGVAGLQSPAPSARAQQPLGAQGAGPAAPVQRKASGDAEVDPTSAGDVAMRGTQDAGASLPYLDQIQRSFGRHDVSNVRAHIGGDAATASRALGAHAYAHGSAVAFAQAPDLHTAAHEAAHIVQQRAGIAPAGLDRGAGDSLEHRADAVADAVVAGRSAEHLLGPIASAGSTSAAVQRKIGPDSPIDGETKYTVRISRSTKLKIAGVPAKLSESFDFGLKDKGNLNANPGKAKVGFLGTQRLVEQSSDGLDAKIKASLVKGSFDLLTAGQLPSPLSDLPLTVKAEVSGPDASLSLEKMDLKLMTVGVAVEGDFTTWLPKEVQARIDAKASIKLEFEFDPQLAKDLIELAKESENVKRGLEFEVETAQAEKKLAELKKLEGSSAALDVEKIGEGTYRNKLMAEEAARKAAPAEIRELEARLIELKELRGRVAKVSEAAAKQIAKITERLELTAGGRLVKKFANKALGLVFKKFLPIYNAISTAKDLYDAAKFLEGLNWDDIGKKIVDGGDGGASLGDGTHREGQPGVGGEGDDGAMPDADAVRADLDRHDHPVLHPAAQAVLDSVQAKGATARPGAKPLSANDQETINLVVPEDLTPDEIKSVSTQLNAAGTNPQDTVEAVIAAVQRIRPFGEKQGPASGHDVTKPPTDVKAPPRANAKAAAADAKHSTKAGAAPSFIDPTPELARRITVDPASGKARYPMLVDVGGVIFTIGSVKTGRVVAQQDDGAYLVEVHVHVDTVPDGAQLKFPNGLPVARGAEQTVVFTSAADLTVRADD